MDLRTNLIDAAREFYHRGWMLGTAGNLSAKIDGTSFWITGSGCHKGKLRQDDFVGIDLKPSEPEQYTPRSPSLRKPSAETSIHAAIYRLFPDAGACYHVHSVPANLAANLSGDGNLALPPLEMIKGLGIWLEHPQVTMPVFENYLEVPRIAQAIIDRFSATPPPVPALLIRNHGVTVWAPNPEQASHRLEIVEYIFQYTIAARQIGLSPH
jgi:methylthioribulose-1-phosphate dehydratase